MRTKVATDDGDDFPEDLRTFTAPSYWLGRPVRPETWIVDQWEARRAWRAAGERWLEDHGRDPDEWFGLAFPARPRVSTGRPPRGWFR